MIDAVLLPSGNSPLAEDAAQMLTQSSHQDEAKSVPLGSPPNANENSIIHVLRQKGEFRTLLFALDVTGLTKHFETGGIDNANLERLKRFHFPSFHHVAGPYTFLAPNDEAFQALTPSELEAFSMTDPRDIRKHLLSHVLAGRIPSGGFSRGRINLARGGSVPVTVNRRESSIPSIHLTQVANSFGNYR